MTDRAARVPARLLEVVTVLLAAFQLYGTWAVRRSWSFTGFLQGLPVALLAALGLAWLLGPVLAEATPEAGDDTAPRVPLTMAVVTGGAGVLASWGWYAGHVPWLAVSGALVLHLLVLSQGVPATRSHAARATPAQLALLLLACLGGSVAALWIHVPEGDDAYYLNQVIASVENPTLPLLSFDAMHGDTSLPIQQVGHRGQLWETLASVVTWATGHPGGDAYYVYIPPVTAFFSVLTAWAFATTLIGPRAGTLAAFFFLVFSVTWGGHYYATGNYTFNRLYQGKAGAFTLGLPLAALFGFRFGAQPCWRTFAYVTLAQSAATLFTSSALVLAPIAAALGALVGLSPDARGLKVTALGGLSTLPVVGMLYLVKLDIDALPEEPFSGQVLDQVVLFGGEDSLRLFLVPAFLFATATLARSGGAGMLLRYLLVCVLFVYNDWTTGFLGEHAGSHLSWRGYWVVPLNLVFAAGRPSAWSWSSVSPAPGGAGQWRRTPSPWWRCSPSRVRGRTGAWTGRAGRSRPPRMGSARPSWGWHNRTRSRS